MPGGRPPKPTRIKELAGNPGRRPLNRAEPKPSAGSPKCPTWLDSEGKKKWKALVPELARVGLLTVVDGDTLAAYCQAWAEFKIATETLKKEGRTFRTESGYLAPHPAVAQQRSAWQAIRAFASLFGLDPSSRSKLSVGGDEPEEDPFEALLRRANGGRN